MLSILKEIFISTAFGQAAAPGAAAVETAAKGPSMIEMLVLPAGFLFIMYFLMIRPQAKKAREQAELMTNLKAGDEVVTSSGIIGRVRSVSDSFVSLEISNNVLIKVLKTHIHANTKTLDKDKAAVPAPAKV